MNGELSHPYDAFIEQALQDARREFGYITQDYPYDLPAGLFWVLCSALVLKKGLHTKQAARVILEFCERRGDEIPAIMNRPVEVRRVVPVVD